MTIHVRFFASIRDATGQSQFMLDLPVAAQVTDAREAVLERFPQVGKLLQRTAFAVNQQYAPADAVLHDGDELAFLPPVSGG